MKWGCTDCSSTTNPNVPESQKGHAECSHTRHDLADNHHLFRVLGNEFIGHCAVLLLQRTLWNASRNVV